MTIARQPTGQNSVGTAFDQLNAAEIFAEHTGEIQQASFAETDAEEETPNQAVAQADQPELITPPPKLTLRQRLKIPPELPGAEAPEIRLPREPEALTAAIDRLFPKLPEIPAQVGPPADGGAWSLAQLEQFAMENNPVLVQASADIDAAAGNAYQAGMYPNPTIGYEGDTVNSGGTLNYQGVFIEQTIKTAGKLELARMSGNIDTLNSQLDARKTRIDVLTKVRANYYGVLVAQENVRASAALVRFTNEVYRVQVEQLQGGEPAAYEPMQLRALAVQARGALQQAKNRYDSAWRQLAASLGTPNMQPQILLGRIDEGVPEFDYDISLAHMLDCHTDIQSARNKQSQAQINVRRAEVVPIPDIGVYTAIQRDFTTPPVLRYTYNLQIGVPVPIFDRNHGGIQAAQAQLVRASEEANRVRNDLTAQLADAFERYKTNQVLVEYYRKQILPDQARAFRGVYERYDQQPDKVGFGDIVVAQQNLLTSITTYLTALNSVWDAVTDVQGLMQLDLSHDAAQLPEGDVVPSPVPPLKPEAIKVKPDGTKVPQMTHGTGQRSIPGWKTGVRPAAYSRPVR